jgi:hypothetical protein
MLKVELIDGDGQLMARGEVSGDRTPHVVRWNACPYTMHALGTSDTPTVYRLAHVAELENVTVPERPPSQVPA